MKRYKKNKNKNKNNNNNNASGDLTTSIDNKNETDFSRIEILKSKNNGSCEISNICRNEEKSGKVVNSDKEDEREEEGKKKKIEIVGEVEKAIKLNMTVDKVENCRRVPEDIDSFSITSPVIKQHKRRILRFVIVADDDDNINKNKNNNNEKSERRGKRIIDDEELKSKKKSRGNIRYEK